MNPILLLIWISIFMPCLLCSPEQTLDKCTGFKAKQWSYGFHNCFIDRKYADGGKDLNNIVDRILDHSGDCIKNSSMGCRPNYQGFLVVMNKVIEQIKDYSELYLEDIIHEREKIKDLDCVEKILSNETYAKCFKSVLLSSSSVNFQNKVEKAISCTNNANKQCSKAAKTSVNRMVRIILGVKQPHKENIEENAPPPPPPKKWYHYIIQPFVSAWNWIKSLFGF